MTEKLYDKDSYIKEFCATVLSSQKCGEYYGVILDKTAFFPESAGQKSDLGTLSDAKVLDVQIKDGIITHITDKPLEVGEVVTGKIDFCRRFDFMQQHSGEHIVSGVAHSLFGCENVGFHLSEDIVTLDFDIPLSDNQLKILEEKSNQAVFENLKFKAYYPDKETLENLEYRSKKDISGDIRIVEIENTDMCACCAPHVKTSGEIGLIKFLNTEKLRGGVRIEIKCGKRALEEFYLTNKVLHNISSALCVKKTEAEEAVFKLLAENKDLNFKLSSIKRQIFELKAQSFVSAKEITALFEDNLEIKDLQFFADLLYKAHGGIRAVFSGNGDNLNFAICGNTQLDAFFKTFKDTFSVKGGGRNGMVQGTVFAKKEDIENFFN